MRVAFYKNNKTIEGKVIYLFQRYILKLEEKHAIRTHCELLFDDDWMYGSSGKENGVAAKYVPKLGEYWEIVEISMSERKKERLRALSESKLGKLYDWVGILFAQALNTNWFLKKDRYFCSEYIVELLQEVKCRKVVGVAPHMVSPGELSMMLE